MSTIGHVVILGSEHRGLWLAKELAKNNFKVTWVGVDENKVNKVTQGPWQIGSAGLLKSIPESAAEMILASAKGVLQEGFQIVTPSGVLDLSKEFLNPSMDRFFSADVADLLKKYLDASKSSNNRLQSLFRSKTESLPKSKRWILDWQGLLRARNIRNFNQDEFSLQEYFIFGEEGYLDLETMSKSAGSQGSDVNILKDVDLLDIGIDGRKVMGVELGGRRGFISCDELIICASAEKMLKRYPEPASKIKALEKNNKEPKWYWVRTDFSLKAGAKPEGLPLFSSFVIDPNLPYEGPGFGMMKWMKDKLSVWGLMSTANMKMQSVVDSYVQDLRAYLCSLIVCLDEFIVDVKMDPSPWGAVYDTPDNYIKGRYYSNIWLSGPETDLHLELASSLKSEVNILTQIQKKYRKELNIDRPIHQARDGRSLEN